MCQYPRHYNMPEYVFLNALLWHCQAPQRNQNPIATEVLLLFVALPAVYTMHYKLSAPDGKSYLYPIWFWAFRWRFPILPRMPKQAGYANHRNGYWQVLQRASIPLFWLRVWSRGSLSAYSDFPCHHQVYAFQLRYRCGSCGSHQSRQDRNFPSWYGRLEVLLQCFHYHETDRYDTKYHSADAPLPMDC